MLEGSTGAAGGWVGEVKRLWLKVVANVGRDVSYIVITSVGTHVL